MKIIILSLFLTLINTFGFAQNQKVIDNLITDSLKHELNIAKQDTSLVLIMTGLADEYKFYKPDSSLFYAQQALALARQIQYPKGEFEALFMMGFTLGAVGNYPRALEMQLKALRIAEKHNFLNRKAAVFGRLGNIYRDAGDYSKAVDFHQRQRLLADSLQIHGQSAGSRNLLGGDYSMINKTDSAQHYFQSAYENINRWKVEWMRSPNFLGLGGLQAKLRNFPLALDYLQKSVHYAYIHQDYLYSTQAYLDIAKIYQQTNQPDSCAFYAQKGNLYNKIANASLFLSSLYVQEKPQLAIHYQHTALAAKDSLSNFGNLTTIQNQVSFDEEERQYEMETAKTAWQNQLKQFALLVGLGYFCSLLSSSTATTGRSKRQMLSWKEPFPT